jgi:hypothetical protein
MRLSCETGQSHTTRPSAPECRRGARCFSESRVLIQARQGAKLMEKMISAREMEKCRFEPHSGAPAWNAEVKSRASVRANRLGNLARVGRTHLRRFASRCKARRTHRPKKRTGKRAGESLSPLLPFALAARRARWPPLRIWSAKANVRVSGFAFSAKGEPEKT